MYLLVLWLLETSLICKVPCLLHLPPTYQEAASVFSLSLPSAYGGHVQIILGKLSSSFSPTGGKASRGLKRWALGNRYPWGKTCISQQPLCGERWPICHIPVDCGVSMGPPQRCWLFYWACLRNTQMAHCGKENFWERDESEQKAAVIDNKIIKNPVPSYRKAKPSGGPARGQPQSGSAR